MMGPVTCAAAGKAGLIAISTATPISNIPPAKRFLVDIIVHLLIYWEFSSCKLFRVGKSIIEHPWIPAVDNRDDQWGTQESYGFSGAQAVKADGSPPSGKIGLTVSTNTLLVGAWMLLERQGLVKKFKKDIAENSQARLAGKSGCSIGKILIYNDINVLETKQR